MRLIKILFSPITEPIRFIQRNFKATLLVLIIVFLTYNSKQTPLKTANLQEIRLNGTIMNADIIVEQINKAKNNKNIKGVLFIVNSGGGAVAPSVEISYAIKELNEIKPVIAYASGTMASGSYYSSIWAKKILANPGSMIGSIGVIMQSANASELLSKIGIKPQSVKIGTYKEAGTPTRAWSQEEKDELNKVIKGTYDMFVYDVVKARNLKIQNQNDFANAHIFTSAQAKEVGLIDDLATINKARTIVKKEAKVKNAIWNKKDKFDKFIEKLAATSIANISMLSDLKLMAK